MRAQANTLDFLLAILLITAGIILVTSFGLPETQVPEIYEDAQTAAQTLFAPYPHNWTNQTVIIPGIVHEYRLKEDLFTQAQTLQGIEARMGIQANLYVNTTLGTIGQAPTNQSTDITKITRYAAYNATITPIEVIVWQD